MPRIQPLDTAHAEGKAKTLLNNVQKSLGRVPTLMQTMAQSPAVLEAYLAFGQALRGSSLDATLREQIALTVAGLNGCDYCASAHTFLGQNAGIGKEELHENLRGESADIRTAAALRFARALVENKGLVSDTDLLDVRAAGYSEGHIAEIIAVVSLNIFSNYFNHVAQTDIDFPKVETTAKQTACGC